MEPVTATAIKITYSSGDLMRSDEFGVCETFISRKGVIRTTFARNMKHGDFFDFGAEHMLPTKESYEYSTCLN